MKRTKLKKHLDAGEYMSNTKRETEKIIVIIVIIMLKEKKRKENIKNE